MVDFCLRKEVKSSSSLRFVCFHCWTCSRRRLYLPAALDYLGEGGSLNATLGRVESCALTWRGGGAGGGYFAGM